MARSKTGDREILILDPEPFLEAFYLSGCVDDALLTGEEWVTATAEFNLQGILCCADGEYVATGTYHLGVIVIFGMYLFFHSVTSGVAPCRINIYNELGSSGGGYSQSFHSALCLWIDADLSLILVGTAKFDQPVS